MFLKILQNSQKSTCVSVSSLIKLHAWCLQIYQKVTCVSCEFYEIFKNTFYIEDLRWLLLFLNKIDFHLNKSAKPSSLPVKFRNCSNPWNKQFNSRRYLNSLFLGDHASQIQKQFFSKKKYWLIQSFLKWRYITVFLWI